MIDIRPIASSSAGNAYYITDGQTPLLIEAGIPIRQIQQAIGFTLSDIAGCLVSHSHNDHAHSVHDLMRLGVDVYMSRGEACELDLNEGEVHRLHYLESMKQYQIGTWRVLPFGSVHDTPEPLGFLLSSGGYKLLFATDTAYLRYRFQGVTHIMIESNHQTDILKKNAESGVITRTHKNRVMTNHFSLENVLKFLGANDLNHVREIWLMHLSNENSNESAMIKAVQMATGVPVYVC